MEEKRITYRQLKKGQKINGTEIANHHSRFTAYIKEINPSFVTVAMWVPDGKERRIDAEAWFLVEMTEEEFREKYNTKAEEVVKRIQNPMRREEIGEHEMCNSWLSSNPWELTQACIDKKLTVLGHCTDIIPKNSWFSGDKLDVGVCVEDEDGERFWCHFRLSDIKTMARRHKRYQEWRRKQEGNIEEILLNVPLELEIEEQDEMKEGTKNEKEDTGAADTRVERGNQRQYTTLEGHQ